MFTGGRVLRVNNFINMPLLVIFNRDTGWEADDRDTTKAASVAFFDLAYIIYVVSVNIPGFGTGPN